MAIGKLTEFEAHFKRTAARPEKIGDAWGIKTKAYVDRITAALRYFGLLEYQGSGKERGIVISEEGRKYLRAHQEETKQEVIKAAALRPKQIAKFWGEWGPDRPADAACMDLLIQKHGFSEGGARDFLKVYDATITYAKLSDSDKIPSDGQEDEGKSEATAVTPRSSNHAQCWGAESRLISRRSSASSMRRFPFQKGKSRCPSLPSCQSQARR